MSNNLLESAEAFKNAYLKLQQFISEDNGSEVTRAGILHAFEFTFELWWKYLQKYLDSTYVLEEHGPSNVIKVAFQNGVLEDGQAYMDMLRDRNLISHTYKENMAEEIYLRIKGEHINSLKVFAQKFNLI